MSDHPSAPPAPRLLLAAFIMAATAPAMALEIETLELHSALGQPLHARARISGPGSERPLKTSIRCLGGACDDLRLRTFVAGRASGTPAVVVRSFSPLRSGLLRIEVEVGNGSDVSRREFSLKVEAPVHRRRPLTAAPPPPAPAVALPGAVAGLPSPLPPRGSAAPLPASPSGKVGASGSEARVVQPGDTLSGIAASISRQHGGGTAVWMERLVAANPDAFIRGDRNRIRAGATLRFDLPRSTALPAPAEPAEPPSPLPAAPALPQAPVPAPAMTGAGAGMAATRTTLAELADDGKALVDRLATLEARIRTLQAELAGREAALDRLKAGDTARTLPPTRGAAASPEVAATAAAREPAGAAASPGAASSVPLAGTKPVAGANVEAIAATARATPGLQAAGATSPPQVAVAASTDAPATGAGDWTLIAATGLVALVLGMVLLLRSLSRHAHVSSHPLRRDDHTLHQQIRERLEATAAGSDASPFAEADEGFDLRTVREVAKPAATEETHRLDSAPTVAAEVRTDVNEDEVVTEVDVKIVYGLFDEAEIVLVEALESAPTSARLLLKLAEVRFYRRDAEALARLAAEVLAQGQRQPAWLWAKIERLGRELCPDREPFAQAPARPGLRSVG